MVQSQNRWIGSSILWFYVVFTTICNLYILNRGPTIHEKRKIVATGVGNTDRPLRRTVVRIPITVIRGQISELMKIFYFTSCPAVNCAELRFEQTRRWNLLWNTRRPRRRIRRLWVCWRPVRTTRNTIWRGSKTNGFRSWGSCWARGRSGTRRRYPVDPFTPVSRFRFGCSSVGRAC